MNLIGELKKKEESPCKGLFFRGRVNRYITSRKGVMEQKELRFLKKKSCKGCERCYWLFDYFNEIGLGDDDVLSNIKHGKLYVPDLHGGIDHELDYVDFKEVKE